MQNKSLKSHASHPLLHKALVAVMGALSGAIIHDCWKLYQLMPDATMTARQFNSIESNCKKTPGAYLTYDPGKDVIIPLCIYPSGTPVERKPDLY